MTIILRFISQVNGGGGVGRSKDSAPLTATCSSTPLSNVSILATSMSREHRELVYNRKFCEDRQTFLEHLGPQRLFKSTFRVTMLQAAQTASKFITDQLKEDVERDDLVSKGVLTQEEADEEADEWFEREWKRRLEEFPYKLGIAMAKYHASIMLMRVYEYLAERFVNEQTLDKLTTDTFKYAKRAADGKQGTELAREMYSVGWRANLISFLADYSVYQVILVYGYYTYVQDQRRQKRKQPPEDKDYDNMPGGYLVLNVLRKSTILAMSRAAALFLASVGGAIGCMVTPAWGTLAGTNLGDGIASTLTEDLIASIH